jgi:uncharacterized membrane protein YfcA
MNEALLIGLIALVAFAYSLVGHGGASGYIALLTLAGLSATVVRPSALVLNVCVSALAFVQFARAGHFQWKLFWPFAMLAVPCAWLGSQVDLEPLVYRRILALCLLVAVARLFGLFGSGEGERREVPLALALAIGAALGLVSGVIGIGGGILLSPILLLFRWADARTTAATSALFILVNSLAGLVGLWSTVAPFEPRMLTWVGVALVGGVVGSWLGARRMPEPRLRQALGVVLFFASFKLFFP